MEKLESALAIVWRYEPWRCEYWKAPRATGTVRLFFGPTVTMQRPVRDVDDMLFVAATWKELIANTDVTRVHRLRTTGKAPTERRQQPPERRRVARGGRRQEDPRK